ncbi:MAG: thioredoxin family protein [Alphaproteobacteria bacterium]|nr:thioredoxin family protein [Alphaproteobacteria bacterium]
MRPPSMGDDPHPVEARLLLDHAVAVAGGTVRVGVQLLQDPHWHTYWRFPGDVGQATQITLTLPDGAVVGERRWPVPERFVQPVEDGSPDLVSYGYDDQVLHTLPVTLPADLAPGTYPVEAEVSWLVCKTSCIPGSATLRTQLDVGTAPQVGPAAPLFDAWAARLPSPLADLAGLRAEVVHCRAPVVPGEGLHSVVELRADEGHTLGAHLTAIDVAPIVGEAWFFADATHAGGMDVAVADGTVRLALRGTSFALDPQPVDPVGALLHLELDGRSAWTEVVGEVPWGTPGQEALVRQDGACAQAAPAMAASRPIEDPPHQDVVPAPATAAGAAHLTQPPPPLDWSWSVLAMNLLAAFVGGLILNVMPCVLPVLTLKLYGLVDQADIPDADKRRSGLAYTAGILVSFWALAAAVWGARSVLGMVVDWGFQFQYPPYVAGLATVVFLFGLSLFGVFEVPAFGTGEAHELSSKEGTRGYFFTGVFATLVATPCSAPFLGAATAFAFQAPTPVLVAIFSAVGLGLASPFLLVAYVPAAFRLLPRPGAWMETLKQVLGFTLVGTTVWLVSVLGAQVGLDRLAGFLAFLTVAGAAAWVQGHFGGVAEEPRRQLLALGAALVLLGGGWMQFVDLTLDDSPVCDDGALLTELDYADAIPWQPFSQERVDALRGRVVFVDFTADWCVSCKVNERTVLESASVREALGRHDVVSLQGDWTRPDPRISDWLHRWGRSGVPMYLVIPPTGLDDAILLPEVITPAMVIDAVEAAATQTLGMR